MDHLPRAQEIAVCEAMRLKSVEKAKIEEHVTKLVERYNPTGARASVVVVYFEGADFATFSRGYRDEIGRLASPGTTLDSSRPWANLDKSRLRAFRVLAVDKDGERMTQDHVLVHLRRRPLSEA